MNEENTLKEKNEQERHTAKIMNAGMEAKSLMQHPMFAQFFSTQTSTAIDLFVNLPDDADLNDYKAAHMRLKAINLLKEHLDRHIIAVQEEQMQLDRKEIPDINI